jgi:hypothetical protein
MQPAPLHYGQAHVHDGGARCTCVNSAVTRSLKAPVFTTLEPIACETGFKPLLLQMQLAPLHDVLLHPLRPPTPPAATPAAPTPAPHAEERTGRRRRRRNALPATLPPGGAAAHVGIKLTHNP